MYYVYVLVEPESGRNYVGFSKNLKCRVVQHQSGQGALYTKSGQWQLVYYEAFASEKNARSRERMLKQNGNAKHQLIKRIADSIDWVKIGAGCRPQLD